MQLRKKKLCYQFQGLESCYMRMLNVSLIIGRIVIEMTEFDGIAKAILWKIFYFIKVSVLRRFG